jgi:hypothetical protein
MKYGVLATRGPIQNSAIAMSQWVLYYSNIQNIGLICGEIIGRFIGISFLFSNIRKLSTKVQITMFKKRHTYKINKLAKVNFFSIGFDMAA